MRLFKKGSDNAWLTTPLIDKMPLLKPQEVCLDKEHPGNITIDGLDAGAYCIVALYTDASVTNNPIPEQEFSVSVKGVS